jgi:hypothetical protein
MELGKLHVSFIIFWMTQSSVHEDCHFPFPGESKIYTRESDMLIGTTRRESVISPLLLVVVLCGYQIYQFLKLVYDLFKPEFRM